MDKIYINVEKKTRMISLTKTKIGNDLENLQQELVFKFTDEFVNGSARLEYKIDSDRYHIPMTKDGESYIVPIKNIITKEGKIEMQLVITQVAQDEEIPVFKSNVFYMYCDRSINAQEEAPDDYEYWLNVIEEKITEMDEALTEVDNLDIDASKSGDTATISITNKEGTTKTVQVKDGIDGQQGETGPANTLSIGTVTKGENASATITGESPNQTLNLVLPKGDKGDKGNTGATGSDGYSPSASVTQLSGGATITITDKTGTTTATITSGEQGPTGPAGKDGKDGKDGTNGTNATINGVSTLTLTAGTNISLDQQGSTLTINATGGSGGSSDYSDLTNKPKINNVELNGNKTSSDLGLQPAGNYLTSETDPVFTASASAGISSSDITNWNNKGTYSKPSGGIPKTDLASAVQTSLGKADTAIQSSDLTNYVTNTDYAGPIVGGVVIVKNGDHGITVDEGVLKGTVRTLAQYNDMSSKGIVCKGTLENVLDDRIGDIETALGGI